MPYVGPVLGEREHVAARAQKSSLRRPAGDAASGTRVLRDAVSSHLSPCRPRPTTSPGTRSVATTAAGRSPARSRRPTRSGTARFTYDVPGNYVTTDNDDARWLVGDLVGDSPRPPSTSTTSSRPGSGGWRRSPPTSCLSATTRLDLVTARTARRPTSRPASSTSRRPRVRAGREPATARARPAERPPRSRRPAPPPSRLQEARPGVGAELGRDHVRRRRPVSPSLPAVESRLTRDVRGYRTVRSARMSYFVTGATGFIGRYLVSELVDHREGPIFVLVAGVVALPHGDDDPAVDARIGLQPGRPGHRRPRRARPRCGSRVDRRARRARSTTSSTSRRSTT